MRKLRSVWKTIASLPKERFILIAIVFSLAFWNMLRALVDFQSFSKVRGIKSINNSLLLNLSAYQLLANRRIKTDKPKSILEQFRDLEEKYFNIPFNFWYNNKDGPLVQTSVCGRLPTLYDITFNNIMWQKATLPNAAAFLYSAYYENRTLAAIRPAVILIGMINRNDTKFLRPYCQFWFTNASQAVAAEVQDYGYMWEKLWGNSEDWLLQPNMLTCQIPEPFKHLVPAAVSLVASPCDKATNLLRVQYNIPRDGVKDDFAVCVKGMEFPYSDYSIRLVEWLEILFELGAKKVFLYDLDVHQNISKLLRHYKDKNLVSIYPLYLPGAEPNIPFIKSQFFTYRITYENQNEIIPYNDCFYRNMYLFKYIVLIDLDEVIMPKAADNWKELINLLNNNSSSQSPTDAKSAYCFYNTYFFDDLPTENNDDIPPYLHIMTHTSHSALYSPEGFYAKCFHNTERVKTLHNHYPFSCLPPGCEHLNVPTVYGHMHHYRKSCHPEVGLSCEKFRNQTKRDASVLKYKNAVIPRIQQVLVKLGFVD